MTEMATDAFALADDPECAMRDAIARHPVGRMGKPEDIAMWCCGSPLINRIM